MKFDLDLSLVHGVFATIALFSKEKTWIIVFLENFIVIF